MYNPQVHTILVLAPSGSRTRDSGAGGGRSTKEAKGYSLLHQSLELGIHPLHVHELFYLIGVILMFCFLT